jgi:hypothetical protein
MPKNAPKKPHRRAAAPPPQFQIVVVGELGRFALLTAQLIAMDIPPSKRGGGSRLSGASVKRANRRRHNDCP